MDINFGFGVTDESLALQSLLLLIEALSYVLEVVEQQKFLLVDLLENVTNLFLNLLHVKFLLFDGNLKFIGANFKHHVRVHYLQVLHLNTFLAFTYY